MPVQTLLDLRGRVSIHTIYPMVPKYQWLHIQNSTVRLYLPNQDVTVIRTISSDLRYDNGKSQVKCIHSRLVSILTTYKGESPRPTNKKQKGLCPISSPFCWKVTLLTPKRSKTLNQLSVSTHWNCKGTICSYARHEPCTRLWSANMHQ